MVDRVPPGRCVGSDELGRVERLGFPSPLRVGLPGPPPLGLLLTILLDRGNPNIFAVQHVVHRPRQRGHTCASEADRRARE